MHWASLAFPALLGIPRLLNQTAELWLEEKTLKDHSCKSLSHVDFLIDDFVATLLIWGLDFVATLRPVPH